MSALVPSLNESELESALSGTDVVVVDFWAEWCGPCKMLAPVLDQVAQDLEGQPAKVVKINVDDNQSLAVKYGIQSIPTLLYFKGGEVKDKSMGPAPKKAILDKIKALM